MCELVDLTIVLDAIEDHPRVFPKGAIEVLQDLNWTTFSEFSEKMFDLLFQVGKADLSVGRIYEGHVNALILINTYGSSQQKQRYFSEAREGKLFGVWNTENPEDGLKITANYNSKGLFLKGSKTFCSGALHIDRPIVTAKTKDGVQMLVLNLDEQNALQEDWSQWDPIGMRPSVSCRIDFTSFEIFREEYLGKINDYYKEPHFSWGAVRFSAVQLGGAQKIADTMLQHLQKTHRSKNSIQQMRIGKVAILMETGRLWMERASNIENGRDINYSDDHRVNFSNMMRTMVLELCEKVILLAEKAVGIQGTMKSHPLERPIRDLRVYLKQAGPDAALAQVGNYTDNRKTYE
ncbi:acyl-CoA dehydrogenase family protein [Gelidibacter gilvus]|uniref:Acyl-CoA dehydrogenase n=1 Tax=Gelidibacter gilvus TaxID=59602 RepID=A0A4Q0XCR6_9FLAO|nr:acyl-CoA dehydrogenase family protein [Gelidibacter gilvus]RXJ44366.1 acyl-CoA dehydrogenase [Gelidibacter gilvus]